MAQRRFHGNRIGEWRAQRQMTYIDVAKACVPASSAATIYRLESGQAPLSLDWMYRLAPVLRCRPRDLMIDDANPIDEIRTIWSRLAADTRAEVLRQLAEAPEPDELVVTTDPNENPDASRLLTIEINDQGHYRASVYYRPRRAPP